MDEDVTEFLEDINNLDYTDVTTTETLIIEDTTVAYIDQGCYIEAIQL